MACVATWRDFCSSSLVALSLGLSFGYGPNSALFHPQESVPHPGEREQMQGLIEAHLLIQAREGYSDHIWGVCKVLYPAFHTFHCVLLWSFKVPSCLQCFWSGVYSFLTSLLAIKFASKIFDSSLHCLALCHHDYGRKCLWAWLQVSWEKLWYNIRTYFSSYLKKSRFYCLPSSPAIECLFSKQQVN